MKLSRYAVSAFLLFTAALLLARTPSTAREAGQAQMQDIHIGETMKGFIPSPNVAADYSIETPFIGHVRFRFEAPRGYEMFIYDQDHKELGTLKNTENGTENLDLYVSSTTYFLSIQIKPSTNTVSTSAPFLLTTTRLAE